ncbi:50S ribosomal protein L5 [Candidatus Dependentiae bacterium]|nr:50S ribosomal protein L5 [Candidatus Dependentiae bacterium]
MSKVVQNAGTKSRLHETYTATLRPQLQQALGLSNIMEVPKLRKIVINVGVKEAVADSRVLNTVTAMLDNIAGQKSVKTLARKSIAGFKIREGMPIGAMVTLRGKRMYDFLDKLINLALPKVRDFQGLPIKLDGRGSYNLGIKDWSIFPEADTNAEKTFGLNVTIQTTVINDTHAFELLKSFGMPFRKAVVR